LRASEVCGLEWSAIDFRGSIRIRRAKLGKSSTHPLLGDEIRALRRLQREQDPKSNWVFTTERGGPPDGFNKFVKRLGEGVLPFSIHAHMLRHSTGYHLADRDRSTRLIQDYLGHRSIASTVRYTELSPTKFKNIW
jgi:type 1 fimbriae regulatory protein FimB/type 1 fimbriae regulatory protein FimE